MILAVIAVVIKNLQEQWMFSMPSVAPHPHGRMCRRALTFSLPLSNRNHILATS